MSEGNMCDTLSEGKHNTIERYYYLCHPTICGLKSFNGDRS